LLAGTSSPSSNPASAAPAPSRTVGPGFTANFSGTVSQSGGGPTLTITVNGPLDRGASGTLAVSLDAQDKGSGSLLVRDGTVKIVNAAGRTTFDGTVSGVQDGVVIASDSSSGAGQLAIQFDTFDTRAGTASGTVQSVSGGGGDDSGRGGGR
jgi:hypothetical protein